MTLYPRAVTRWVNVGEGLFPLLERGLAWAVIATVFFLPLSEALKNIFFLVSLAVYLAVIFVGRERIAVPGVGWLFLSFLGVTILSAAVSAYPGKAIKGVWEVFRYTSFFFIVERGVRQKQHVQVVLWAAVTGLGLTALVAIFRYVLLYPSPLRALGLGQHNDAAAYAVMGLALMFGIYVHTDVGGRPLVGLVAAAVLSVIFVGLSHARISWGALILVGAVLGWLRSARVAVTALAISVLMVLGVGLVDPEVRGQIASLKNIEVYKGMGERGTRVKLWEKGTAVWRDAPWLGVGPRVYKDMAEDPQQRKYGLSFDHMHNIWVHTAVELGAVGLVILVATFGYIGVWLFRSRGAFASSWPAAIWDGALGSWLAILVAGVTEVTFGRERAMFFLMLLALLQMGVTGGKGPVTVMEGRTE